MMKKALILILLAVVAGCGTARISRKEILAASDRAAVAELARVNRDETYGEDRPFHLREYRRRMSSPEEMNYDDLPPEHRYWVFYETDRPVSFLGHPQHFTVIVDPETMETELMGGE